VSGWLDWGTGADNTNTQNLTELPFAVLAPYFAKQKNVYKCVADIYTSRDQKARGWRERVRSVSGNIYVGKGNGWSSGLGYDAGGPNNLSVYRGAEKASALQIPGPALTWVYMDEHPDSINDAGAFPPNTGTNIPDAPATYHNGAAGFAMADGHSEVHKWRGPTMTRPRNVNRGLKGVNFLAENNFATVSGDPDLRWFALASPRLNVALPAGW
jgi:prepilin-type processing-associated H-X9-DG protein